MIYKILGNDARSLNPFRIGEIEAKDKEEAYEILDGETNFPCQDWVLKEEEFKQLKELINNWNKNLK